MLTKKYIFSKTLPLIADIVAKVRLMQHLTQSEEMIYLMQVKGLPENEAQKIIAGHTK